MDAEDSPWGDVPSRSSSDANLTKPAAGETQGAVATDNSTDKLAQIKVDSGTKPSEPNNSSLSSPPTPRSPAGRGPRTRGKVVAKATTLEAVDDPTGPLGPLGENYSIPEPDQPPAPPSKEQSLPIRNARQSPHSPLSRSVLESNDTTEDDRSSIGSKQRYPQHGQQLPGAENARRNPQPSVSIEQAARPTFDITVGDPHKVGDLTSSHIVYQVRTKTSSKAYKQGEFSVSRRYRDFLWLYETLHGSNPGVVVPPPPEKQAVGRFDTNFVESRRAALERMLNKTAAHPILQHDGDLKIFLESDAFNMDVKHREHKEPFGTGESVTSGGGMLKSLGIGSSTSGKFIEHDDWFHDRKVYLDALENQLKALLKSIDSVVAQRKALAEAAGDFSASLHALSTVELSVSLSTPLASLSDLQLRIRDLYDRQAQTDVLTLGITVDEYIRLIASIKTAFAQRQKSFHSWHAAEAELAKRRANQDKVMRSGKTQQDRLNQLQADVGDGERRCHQARLLFEDMGRLMRGELERFEREKVEDFKGGLETFLEGAIEAQKELIELWETFLMQLDADDDAEPFFRPPPVAAAPIPKSGEAPLPPAGEQQQQQQGQQQQQHQQQRQQAPIDDNEETVVASSDGETSQPAAAATATLEQEE